MDPVEAEHHLGTCADCNVVVEDSYRCPACTRLHVRTQLVDASWAPPPKPAKAPDPLVQVFWLMNGARNCQEWLRNQRLMAGVILALVAAAILYIGIFGAGTIDQPHGGEYVASRLVNALANGDVAGADNTLCQQGRLTTTSLAPGDWRYLGQVTTPDLEFRFGLPTHGPTVTVRVVFEGSDYCVEGLDQG